MTKLMTLSLVLAFAGSATADDKKPEAKKPEPAKKEEAKPAPAPEMAEMAKTLVGSWKCAGKAMDMTGGAIEFKNVALKQTLDLDKMWIKGEMTGQMGPMKVHNVDYITFDASQKKWYRVMVGNYGNQETDVSTDGKTWEGESRMPGMTMKSKAAMEVVSPKEWKVTAQMSMDGKKWAPAFEMTCKK